MKTTLKTFLCVVVAMLLTAGLQAQAPGYLGKRVSLGYRFYAFPSSSTRSYNELSEKVSLQFHHSGDLDIVLNRRTSLGFNCDYYRMGFPANSRHMRLSGVSPGISFRFYPFLRRGNLAPLGPHMELGFSPVIYSVFDPDGPPQPGGTDKVDTYRNANITLGWGRNFILRDLIILNYGGQFGVLLGRELNRFNIETNSETRIQSAYTFNLFVGCGVLLF